MKIRFKRNMSTADRVLRTVIGLGFMVLGPVTTYLTNDSLSNVILGTLGVFAIASSAFSYCLLYEIAGFCTLKEQSKA